MNIHYVPNDPRASAYSKPREQAPRERVGDPGDGAVGGTGRADRGAVRAVRRLSNDRDRAPDGGRRLEQFCREGTDGARAEQEGVDLVRDAGEDINAYDGYSAASIISRRTLVKFSVPAPTRLHEVGHALLDTIRSELWD
jgi:hypothetical protein